MEWAWDVTSSTLMMAVKFPKICKPTQSVFFLWFRTKEAITTEGRGEVAEALAVTIYQAPGQAPGTPSSCLPMPSEVLTGPTSRTFSVLPSRLGLAFLTSFLPLAHTSGPWRPGGGRVLISEPEPPYHHSPSLLPKALSHLTGSPSTTLGALICPLWPPLTPGIFLSMLQPLLWFFKCTTHLLTAGPLHTCCPLPGLHSSSTPLPRGSCLPSHRSPPALPRVRLPGPCLTSPHSESGALTTQFACPVPVDYTEAGQQRGQDTNSGF